MPSLGIRVTPKEVYYAITKLEEGKPSLLICDKIVVPNACIRVVEANAQSYDYNRLYIEGVMQVMIASSTIERYYFGRIASMSNKLGIDRKDFSALLSSDECGFITEWSKK